MKKILAIIAASLLAPSLVQAKVVLPHFITDSMVVQHNSEITIPGTAKKRARVTITPSWLSSPIKVKADAAGRFTAKIPTPDSGGPYSISFSDGQTTTISDILAGEVWFCSGQSNMEMPVGGWGNVANYRQEIAEAGNPNLRLLQVAKQRSFAPQADTEANMGGWRTASPSTVAGFSAIGYFFGRDLQPAIGMPVGIIDCTWGGTPIEAWMAYETLAALGQKQSELELIKSSGFDSSLLEAKHQQAMKEWNEMAIPRTDTVDIASLRLSGGYMPAPAQWETSVLPGFDGIVWMQRDFDMPATCAGREGTISLAMIDEQDETYVNGRLVGKMLGYNTPRVYEIPAGVLRPGRNTVTIKVTDSSGEGGIWGHESDMWVKAAGHKAPLAGNWAYEVLSDFTKFPPKPVSPSRFTSPTVLYNAMASPILSTMPLAGVLWYQGCSNVGRAADYSVAFKAMIEAWRNLQGNESMPFYFVQIASYLQPKRLQPESQWAALRQAQADALLLSNTAMVVTTDLGDSDDIHPKNKQEVARRLLNIALNRNYGKVLPAYSPMLEEAKADGREITLTFDSDVIMYNGGKGFIVKDAEGAWSLGYGRQIASDTIVVVSDNAASPVEIRFNWADYPEGQIYGMSGLPLVPFSSELKN